MIYLGLDSLNLGVKMRIYVFRDFLCYMLLRILVGFVKEFFKRILIKVWVIKVFLLFINVNFEYFFILYIDNGIKLNN